MLSLCCCAQLFAFLSSCRGWWWWGAGGWGTLGEVATLPCTTRASHCGGFFCWEARALECSGFSSYGLQALEHRLSSCGVQALLLHKMWDLPRPGIKLVSPALADRFFFFFLEFYYRNNYKRENNIINSHVPITQLQLLSTFRCSFFFLLHFFFFF